MRRMKIRAKPNFGVGGGGAPRSSSVKGSIPSQSSAPCQEAQKSNGSPKEDHVCPPLTADVNEPLAGSVEPISVTQGEGSDTSSTELQEESNKSCENFSTSSSSQVRMSPQSDLTDIKERESLKVTVCSAELQQTAPDNISGSSNAICTSVKSCVSSKLIESHAYQVPPSEAQPLQVCPDASVSQFITQSLTQTLEVAGDQSGDILPSSAAVPSDDKASEVIKETQDMEAKSAACMRRKKLKVRPVLGSVRKGPVIDKPKVKASDNNTNGSDVNSQCVQEKASDNNTNGSDVKSQCVQEKASHNNTNGSDVKSQCVQEKASDNNTNGSSVVESECVKEKPSLSTEDVNSPENVESKYISLEAQERVVAKTDIAPEKPNNQIVETIDSDKQTSLTPESCESREVCPVEKVCIMKKDTNQENATLESTYKVMVVEDNTDIPVIMDQKPRPVGDSQTSQAAQDRCAPVAGYKRRARIRAQPTILAKKKKEDDKVITAKPIEQVPTEIQSLEETSSQECVSGGNESAEISVTTVKLSADCNTSNHMEHNEVRLGFDPLRKEVRFAEPEVDRKQSCQVNITDNNRDSKEMEQSQKLKKEGIHATSKEPEQSQKLKKEGIHATCKDSSESPLHSNIKTCRKKKLSENNETDPELEVVNIVNSSVEKGGKKRSKQENAEEIVNSDDSTGDKENASSTITELSRQERVTKENKSVATQKSKIKTSPSEYSSKDLFGRLGRKIKIEDSVERAAKQVFRKRKDEFRKKLSKGDLEPSKMTMFDLIFWNPASNPMPGRTSSPKRNAYSSGRSETESITSETAEEQQVDDQGLDPTDSEQRSCSESPEVVEVTKQAQDKCPGDNIDNTEEEKGPGDDTATNDDDGSGGKNIFAPRVKIGPNGEIIVDEQSIKIQTTAAKNRDEVLSKAVVIEESGDSSHYGRWSKRRRKSCEWTVKETSLFYKALSTVGTDFSLMETLIKWRTRAELKTKFKKEERNNRDLVDLALNDSTQFDMTGFEEESDYDPKEDRKAARKAERAEARQRRLEMKQQDKIQEMEKKKLENKKNKVSIRKRKKVLRRTCKNRGKRRKETFESDNEDSPSLDDSDNNVSEDSVPEEPQPCRNEVVKPRVTLRRRQAKRRNSLVISEVTVTMETVKYDRAADEVIKEQTVEECEVSLEDSPPSPKAGTAIKGGVSSPHEDTHPVRAPEYITTQTSDEHIDREEQEGEEEMLLNECSEFPLSDGLPESYIIEGMLSENAETNPDIKQVDNAENNDPNIYEATSVEENESAECAETATELEPYTPSVEPTYDEVGQKIWHFPISAIQTLEDGRQVIVVPTPNGQYSVPVPVLPPGTSNVVVVATSMPDSPGEHIYHVYIVSPLEAVES